MDNHSNANRCLSPVPAAKPQEKRPPDEITLSERIAFQAAHPHDWPYVSNILTLFPERIACAIARNYCALSGSKGRYAANTYLREQKPLIQAAGIALRADDDHIRTLANDYSSIALRSIMGLYDDQQQYDHLAAYCESHGIEAPEPDDHKGGTVTQAGCIKRMTQRSWWLRRLRAKLQQERESLMIRFGLVQQRKDLYCSRDTLRDHEEQTSRNAQILANTRITDGTDTITLAEAAAATVANPEIRAAELMTRLKGYEQMTKEAGLATLFITVTCPSRMHSHYRETGRPNPNYDHTTPKEAHQYLQATWAMARAELARQKIRIAEGYRIAEPHHDGCPHWHLALSADPTEADALVDVIQDYFTREDPTDKGIENRVKIEHIHTSIAGYMAKYISKNIDGANVDKDLYGKDAKASANRVRAWASTWGIRQFQPIGGPSVTVWRELRRVRDREQVPADMLPAWDAANEGDWAAFTKAQGGFNTPRDSHVIKLAKAWNEQTNRYGETMGYITIGVETRENYLNTRPKEWTVVSTCNQISESLAAAMAEAMGRNAQDLGYFEAYAAALQAGSEWPETDHNSTALEAANATSVQLFTQGQGVSLTAPVAPTGAEKRQPNAPPEPETPPLWAYDDHQTATTGYPEATGCPAEYEDYAEYLDGMGDPAPMSHGHVA